MTESTAHETTAPELVHGCPAVEFFGQKVVFVPRDKYIAVVKALVVDGFDVCVDLTGVDYLTHPARSLPADISPERFEVVVNLLSLEQRQRLRLRVQVAESDAVLPSLFDLHPGTEAHERETFDMFGISFEGHPDMTRILMPEDWDGHPLRKDYSAGAIPVQFKGANS